MQFGNCRYLKNAWDFPQKGKIMEHNKNQIIVYGGTGFYGHKVV